MREDFWIKYALCTEVNRILSTSILRDWHESEQIEELRKRADRTNELCEKAVFKVQPFYFAKPLETRPV